MKSTWKRSAIIIAAGFLIAGGIGQGVAGADEFEFGWTESPAGVPAESGLQEIPEEEQEPVIPCADGEILNDAEECVPNEPNGPPPPQERPVPISCIGADGRSSGEGNCPPRE